MSAAERGAAPIESIFAIVVLLFLTLSVIQVAFALYGRNVIAASAHEGARAAIELGRGPDDAATVAIRTVRSSTGGLVDDLAVDVEVNDSTQRSVVTVRVSGVLEAWGPVPLPIPVVVHATAARDASVL